MISSGVIAQAEGLKGFCGKKERMGKAVSGLREMALAAFRQPGDAREEKVHAPLLPKKCLTQQLMYCYLKHYTVLKVPNRTAYPIFLNPLHEANR